MVSVTVFKMAAFNCFPCNEIVTYFGLTTNRKDLMAFDWLRSYLCSSLCNDI